MAMKTSSRNSAFRQTTKVLATGLILIGIASIPKLLKSQDLQTVPYNYLSPHQSAMAVSATNNPKNVNNYAVDFFRFTGNPALALTYFLKALECGGGAAVNYNAGTAYLLAGKLEDAISELKRAVDISPFFARAHYNLACALLAKGDAEGAADCFRKAIALDPTNSKYSDGYKNMLLGGVPASDTFVKIQ